MPSHLAPMIAVAKGVYRLTRFLTVGLMALSCLPATSQAQVQWRRIPMENAPVVIQVRAPRLVFGAAVAVQEINGVLLGFGDPPAAEEPANADAIADPPPKPGKQVILYSGTFDDVAYGNGSNAVDARSRLERRLQQKLEAMERIIGLNESQKQKLHLAGRGDIKRLLDRTEKLKALCNRFGDVADVKQFQKWVGELKGEVAALRHPLDAGPFESDSLMAKCLKTVLTSEEVAKFNRFEATPPYQPPERRPAGFEGAIKLR